jgi:hypothetical protein
MSQRDLACRNGKQHPIEFVFLSSSYGAINGGEKTYANQKVNRLLSCVPLAKNKNALYKNLFDPVV